MYEAALKLGVAVVKAALRTLRMQGRGPVDLTPLSGITGLTVELPQFRSLKVTGAELLGEGSRVVRDAPFLRRRG